MCTTQQILTGLAITLKGLYSNLSTIYHRLGPQRIINKNIQKSCMKSIIEANNDRFVVEVLSQHDLEVLTSVGLIICRWIISKHFKMYVTIADIMGEKRIDLAYPVQGEEVAVVSVFGDNVQYWLKEPMKVLLKTDEEKELSKGVYMDKELNATIGLELKLKMVFCDYAFQKNKLEHVMEMVISLNELDNTDNLEKGRPSNVLFRCHVTDSKEFTSLEPATPQYKKLKKGELTSLNLRMADQNGNIMIECPGTTVVLHI